MDAARPITRHEWVLVASAVVSAVFIALLVLPSFGQGTDEYGDFVYAADEIRAYAGSRSFVGTSFHELYGPFHLMLAHLFSQVAIHLWEKWTLTDGRHLANFLTYLVGLIGFYILCRRNIGPYASGLTVILLGSQPMLLGHAFINEKDSPFMAYFILSVALGLTAVDKIKSGLHKGTRIESRTDVMAGVNFRTALSRDLWNLGRLGGPLSASAVLALVIASGLLVTGILVQPAAEGIIRQAYAGEALAPFQWAFDRVASDAYKTPLTTYLSEFDLVYAWLKVVMAGISLLLAGIMAREFFPRGWEKLARQVPEGWPWLLLGGVLLGLANSIRIAAPLAGLLVSAYLLVKLDRSGWWLLIPYGLTAVAVSYLTWPWLWRAPFHSYSQSLRIMSNFPPHRVLFGGVVYSSTQIPGDYIPWLVALQTTEVVLPLFAVGLVIAAWKLHKNGISGVDNLLWIAWLVLPVLILITMRSPLYGNLRQVLFVLPPLFLLAAEAVQWIAARLKGAFWETGLALLLLLPSAVGIISLHPYEDSYFNAWAGWTSGAFGRYQVDPWCTSYREAAAYLNANAPDDAIVNVRGPFQSVEDFTDARLELHPDYDPAPEPDYVVMCQIDALGAGYYRRLPETRRITRGRAVLAIIRG